MGPQSTAEVAQHPAVYGMRSTLIGMALNVALAAGKFTAGILGHSYALIADGIESLTDVGSSLVVYVSLRIAKRPPDENHPYGHGKAEPLAATLVSFALFGAAVALAMESVHRIRTPHPVPQPYTLAVLAAVVLVKEGLFRFVIRVGGETESTAVKTDAWHHRADALTSALAFIGISIAIWGGPAWASADAWAALLAAGLIAFNAYHLLQPAVAELSDAAPEGELMDHLRGVALSVNGVKGLDKSLLRKMGFDYYLDIHVLVDAEISVRRGHEIAHAVKDSIRDAYPQVADVLVHIEPMQE